MENISDETIIRFLNGDMDKAEMMEFESWLKASPHNQTTFENFRKIWLATAASLDGGKYDHEAAWEKVRGTIRKKGDEKQPSIRFLQKSGMRPFLRIAAMFVIFFSLGAAGSWLVFTSDRTTSDSTYCEIVAPQGSKSFITLPDGSRAWINAGSKLSYKGDFNKKDRIVMLEGEGYFDVSSNKAKPFIVQTTHLKVKAFGTVFNVKAYPEDESVEATLIEGLVTIETEGRNRPSENITLKPKQNIIYHKDSGITEQKTDRKPEREAVEAARPAEVRKDVQVISNIKPELYTSWKDENWVIEGMPLDQLAILMGRRYNSRIEIRDERLGQYKFTGTIQNETLEQVLVILSLTTPLEYTVGKGNVTWMLNRDLEKNYSRILKK